MGNSPSCCLGDPGVRKKDGAPKASILPWKTSKGLMAVAESLPGGIQESVAAAKQAAEQGLPHQVEKLGPPLPPCEDERLVTMRALDLLDAPPDPEVESILNLVSSIFDAPAALVAFFGEKRIFITEAKGAFHRGDFPWRMSFCAWTMTSQNAQTLVVPDATKDARFADNYMVQSPDGPGVRFYAGTPLLASNGHRLGTLCFADTKPRTFDAGQCLILNNFAEMVVRHVEKDMMLQLETHDNKALSQAYSGMKRAVDCMEQCVVLLDMSEPGFKILYANQAWETVTGLRREGAVGHALSEVLVTATGEALPLASGEHADTIARGSEVVFSDAHIVGDKITIPGSSNVGIRKFTLRFRPASKETFDDAHLPIGMSSFLDVAGTTTQQYYFMTIAPADVPKKAASSIASAFSCRSISSAHVASIGAIEGLKLSHLLGKGAFGSVFSGTWLGALVAVKVIDQDVRKLDAAGGVNIEAVLSAKLLHPNVVRTLKYAVTRVEEQSGSSNLSSYMDITSITSSSITASSVSTSVNAASVSMLSSSSSGDMKTTRNPLDTIGELTEAIPVAAGLTSTDVAIVVDCSGKASPFTLMHSNSDSVLVEVLGKPGKPAALLPAAVDIIQPVGDSYGSAMLSGQSVNDSFGWGASFTPIMEKPRLDSETLPGSVCSVGLKSQTLIVMEHCDKGSLQDAVDRGWLRDVRSYVTGNVNMEAVLATASEIASALMYLHSNDIIHGDLSAFNVLLSSAGSTAAIGNRGFVAKIADFGLARSLDIRTKIQTRTYGTLTHMPPEVLIDGTLSKSVDVYSFGVLLWQMYNSSRPWAGMTHGHIIMTVASKKQLAFPPGAPQLFVDLARSCMAFDPEERPSLGQAMVLIRAMQGALSSP